MKKYNAMLIAGSLLLAGAIVTPALAYDDCYDHLHHHWSREFHHDINRYTYVNPYVNPYYAPSYTNSYVGNYGYYRAPGLFTRAVNRIL